MDANERSRMITLTLPWPPSVNHYWRMWRGRMLISLEGREYRKRVLVTLRLAGVEPMSGPLAVEIDAFPPDRRRRDTDNLLKAALDALQHAGVYDDDSQIEDLHIRRRGIDGGRLVVRIAEAVPA